MRAVRWAALTVLVATAAGCARPAPRAIAWGVDNCHHCHMTIADARFAAELVTSKGKVYVFDDVACLLAFVREGTIPAGQVHSLWVYDYLHPDSMIDAHTAVYLEVDTLRTPMSSHLAALRPGPSADSMHALMGGRLLDWNRLPVRGHGG